MKALSWTNDNDYHFGPFTYAKDHTYRPFAVVLSSRNDDGRPCNLRMSALGHTLIVALPNVIRPYQEKVQAQYWDPATIARLGRDWYWRVDTREYGFTLSDGHLSVFLGRQTDDSTTEQRWGCFLPWTQWRFERKSLYDQDGNHFWTSYESARLENYDRRTKAERDCPSLSFAFADFDGEILTVLTRIEEYEWRFGTGYFKWLSSFRKPRIERSLSLTFSGETGKRKGSWKGGTIGHSIKMLPGELHESAFRRYCAENGMEFLA